MTSYLFSKGKLTFALCSLKIIKYKIEKKNESMENIRNLCAEFYQKLF